MHDFILHKSFDLLLQLNHTIPADIFCNYCRPHLHFNVHKQYEKNKDSLWLIRCFFNVFEYAYWNMNYSYVTIHDMHFNPDQNVFILVFTNTIDPCLDTRRNWQKELEAECNRFHLQNLFLYILVFSLALLKRNLVYWQKEFLFSGYHCSLSLKTT